jgi:allantoicase
MQQADLGQLRQVVQAVGVVSQRQRHPRLLDGRRRRQTLQDVRTAGSRGGRVLGQVFGQIRVRVGWRQGVEADDGHGHRRRRLLGTQWRVVMMVRVGHLESGVRLSQAHRPFRTAFCKHTISKH